jgi:hypothetical protein
MKKGLLSIAVLLAGLAVIWAQNAPVLDSGAAPAAASASSTGGSVDREEMQNLPRVRFINYAGPYRVVSTRTQIMELGRVPGRAIRAREGATDSVPFGSGDMTRYFVIHCVNNTDEGGKLNADIFGLGRNVGVDNIRPLRMVLQGYLEEAYGYYASDAALLAQFINVYNAVYRGNWKYLQGRYKSDVIKNLNEKNAGLSTNYVNWPGGTLMLIPLRTAKSGSLSALDTTSLTSPAVTANLQKAPDRSVPVRQDMVGLKEREAQQAGTQAAAQQKQIAVDTASISKAKQEAGQEKQQAQQQKEAAQKKAAAAAEKAASAKTPAEKQAAQQEQQQAKQEETQAAQKEKAADEKEAALAKQETALDNTKKEAAANKELAQQKTEEARNERENIAQDQQAIIKTTQVAPPAVKGILGFTTEDNYLTPVEFDPASGRVINTSDSLNSIVPRSVVYADGRCFAVAGKPPATKDSKSVVRLVEIDPAALDIKAQGTDDMYPDSPAWVDNNNIYALIPAGTGSGSGAKLARFGLDLKEAAASTKVILPDAVLLFTNSGGTERIVTQAADGSPLALDPETLQ